MCFMEISLYPIKAHPFSPSLDTPKTRHSSTFSRPSLSIGKGSRSLILSMHKGRKSSIFSQSIHLRHVYLPPGNLGLGKNWSIMGVECAKESQLSALERELQEEMDSEEWMGIMGRWREKCRGRGIAELMECLEREAIMGEDQGREPADYSRRARMFSKSSIVFKALKKSSGPFPGTPDKE